MYVVKQSSGAVGIGSMIVDYVHAACSLYFSVLPPHAVLPSSSISTTLHGASLTPKEYREAHITAFLSLSLSLSLSLLAVGHMNARIAGRLRRLDFFGLLHIPIAKAQGFDPHKNPPTKLHPPQVSPDSLHPPTLGF